MLPSRPFTLLTLSLIVSGYTIDMASNSTHLATGSPRRRLSTDQRRREFIHSATELLGTNPAVTFSMNEVAQRAGASRALLYHYFPSKQELIRAVVAQESADLGEALEAKDLNDALDAYLRYVEAHPVGYRLLHDGALQADPEVKATIEQARAKIEHAVRTKLGITSPTELTRLAIRGWTGFVVAVCLEWAKSNQPRREEVHALLFRALPGTATR